MTGDISLLLCCVNISSLTTVIYSLSTRKNNGARLAGRRRRARERVRGMSESPPATSESAGEGVAVNGVRVSRSRRGHSTTVTGVLGRVWR